MLRARPIEGRGCDLVENIYPWRHNTGLHNRGEHVQRTVSLEGKQSANLTLGDACIRYAGCATCIRHGLRRSVWAKRGVRGAATAMGVRHGEHGRLTCRG
jgi:hypothetical protein